MRLKEAKQIFVVGIGGIGTSALTRILHARGKKVSGSDLVASEITQALQKEGISVIIGHKPDNLSENIDLVIYSPAVPEDNRERIKALKLGIPEFSYPQALAQFASDKKVIAVAGTNGKTTTTAMIAWILEQAGFDPTAVVGSEVLAWKSNARAGKGEYLVLEADEYHRAFLNYSSDIAVITNIAADHLDYFKDMEDIKSAFAEFVSKIKPGRTLVYNSQDTNSKDVARRFIGTKKVNVIASPPEADEAIPLSVPGKFNQANAAAATAACKVLGVADGVIKKALQSFTGTWRRFERVGSVARPPARLAKQGEAGGFIGNVEIISDYAHHPAGIKATLQMVVEEFPEKKVLVVFQPHQHNRTKMLFKDFVSAFCQSTIENFIIAEIFEVAGREETQDQDISSQDLVREIARCGKKVEYAKDLAECEAKVRNLAGEYDMIIFMGAGDIYKVANNLIKK